MSDGKIIDTRKLTLLAVMSAVYAVLSLLPGFVAVGISGATIDLVRTLEIAYGLILGPVYGSLAAFSGAVIGKLIKGQMAGLYFTPLAPMATYVAAMLGRSRAGGWKYAGSMLSILILIWYLNPVGREVWYIPVLQVLGLIIIILGRDRIRDMINGEDRRALYLGTLLCSYPSTIAGHMLGNLIFLFMFQPPAVVFIGILPLAAFERILITIGATLIAAPLLVAVRRTYPELLED